MISLTLLFLIFGLLVGSFLNVVVHRLPLNKSVVTPRSSCPECGHMISWYENLPVISYLLLRAKCSACKARISMRYPLMEIFIGVISILLMPSSFTTSSLLLYFFYFTTACIFTAHFLIDLEHQILPDKLNIFLLAIFLIYACLFKSFIYWSIGGIFGFCIPYFITWLFYKIRGVVGLGGGDIKLYGILGIYLGALGIIQTMFVSCFFGAVIGLILIALGKMKRNSQLAFGPFIILTATLQIFFPDIFRMINPFAL